jgi:putative ABC transport system permease protein
MDLLWQEFRYSWRSIWKNPVLSLTIIVTLGLAIGANTAVFTVLNEVLSKSLPFPDSERIVMMVQEPLVITSNNYRDLLDAMKRSHLFEAVAVNTGVSFALRYGTVPERVFGLNVTSEMMKVLRVQPALGRFFRADEENQSSPTPLLLSHSCWKKRFGGNYDVLNKTVRIDGESAVIIGVLPKSVEHHFGAFEVWLPFNALSRNRPRRFLFLVSRLSIGSSIQSADAFLKATTKHMTLPTDANIRLVSMVERRYEFQKESVPALILWMGVAGFILLIACANVVNLLLARGSRKEKEITVRISLGATRMHMIRLLIMESSMLAILGGMCGWILAFWAKDIFGEISYVQNARFDFRVLSFAFLISLAAGLIAGIFPALQLSRADLVRSLKQEGRGLAGGNRMQKTRSLLVITEISLAVVLLTGAALLIKGLILLMAVDPGFETRGIVAIDIPMTSNKYSDPQQRFAFFEQYLEKIQRMPQVRFAALTTNYPLQGASEWNVRIEGDSKWVPTTYQIVSSQYFQVLGLPIQGRSFENLDRKDSTRVAVINESFAKQFWPGQTALGKEFLYEQEEDRPVMVIGVVKDIPQSGLDQKIHPLSYLSHVQEPTYLLTVLARSSSPVGPLLSALQKRVWEIDPDQPAGPAVTLEQSISDSLSERRTKTWLLFSLGMVGFVISMIGIFAMMSYNVACRKQEIGVRMALGAQRKDILKMITKQGAALAIVGLWIGVTAAVLLTRFLVTMIYGVTPTDPATFIIVCIFFLTAAMVASYFPARRASKIDPVITLHHE